MTLTALLAILLGIQITGPAFFNRFATEVSPWATLAKWGTMHALTIALYFVAGAWCLLVPGIMLALGVSLHIHVCRRYGIHPLRATPRRAYYELRGWAWPPE
jgi:hypothetical protein